MKLEFRMKDGNLRSVTWVLEGLTEEESKILTDALGWAIWRVEMERRNDA